eukprot:2103861-Rhodomonas_salina.1
MAQFWRRSPSLRKNTPESGPCRLKLHVRTDTRPCIEFEGQRRMPQKKPTCLLCFLPEKSRRLAMRRALTGLAT